MSHFSVRIVTVDGIEPIAGADLIELAVIGEYRSVIKKNQFRVGDLVAYIPEASLLPDALIEELGLTGKLAGSKKNRVKAVRLRGEVSQGILLPAREGWNLGDDVKEILGIVKYEPEIPAHLRGSASNAGEHRTMTYDVENWKRWPWLIPDDEIVVITEKLHGTCCIVSMIPDSMVDEKVPKFFVASKGLSHKGLVFDPSREANFNNAYVRAARQHDLESKFYASPTIQAFISNGNPVHLLGEVFGSGIQDLNYGLMGANIAFRAFDIYVGARGAGRFLNDDELDALLAEINVERVPVLYRGPFNKDILLQHTTGVETISGFGRHIREGVVVRPVIERKEPKFSDGLFRRVQLKSVSDDYLFRKNGTEFN